MDLVGTVFDMFYFCWVQRTGNSQDFPSVDPVPSGSSIVFNIQKTGSSDHAEVRKGCAFFFLAGGGVEGL